MWLCEMQTFCDSLPEALRGKYEQAILFSHLVSSWNQLQTCLYSLGRAGLKERMNSEDKTETKKTSSKKQT